MKKLLLIFGGILIGMTAFGQQTNAEAKAKTIKSERPVELQIEELEGMITRFGENHEESIKAKAMIAALRKGNFAEEQKRMKETLSDEEYNNWKAKQTKNTKVINKSEEKK